MSSVNHSFRIAGLALVPLALALGCIGPGPAGVSSLRIGEMAGQGDAARRASLGLLIEGLELDSSGGGARARSQYERAIQVDPTNPYAYLALARHHIEGNTSDRALDILVQCRGLLASQGELSPEVEVHLDGLRGQALFEAERFDEAIPLLDRAGEQAPAVWGDGRLTASELL